MSVVRESAGGTVQALAMKAVSLNGAFLVAEAMRRGNGNQSLAAQLLGVSQSALSHRLKKQAKG